MSSSGTFSFALRRGLVIGVLALGACGFTPVYGPGGSGGKLQNSVAFTAPATELGFRVRTTLEDRFGPISGSAADYSVNIALSSRQNSAAVNDEGDITRLDIQGTARWDLTNADQTYSTGGDVRATTSYSATGTTVATQAAERDAVERLAQILADRIAADLILASGSLP